MTWHTSFSDFLAYVEKQCSDFESTKEHHEFNFQLIRGIVKTCAIISGTLQISTRFTPTDRSVSVWKWRFLQYYFHNTPSDMT